MDFKLGLNDSIDSYATTVNFLNPLTVHATQIVTSHVRTCARAGWHALGFLIGKIFYSKILTSEMLFFTEINFYYSIIL